MMRPEDRQSKVAERCSAHPDRDAVARCEACGLPVCLACAVPVRGGVVGVGCVVDVLGEQPQPAAPETRTREALVAGTGLAVAAVASFLPWTRFGVGSGLFGGWDAFPGWSLVASAVGVGAFVAWMLLGVERRRGAAVAALTGAVIAAAALMAWIHPPAFTKPSVGPVVAFLGGLTALVSGVLEARRSRRVG